MSETAGQFRVEHQEGIDLRIYDPALRREYSIEAPGQGDRIDGIFYEILTSPAGLRALGINQLSKSPMEETYEGSYDLKRWQHVAGVYKITRHFGRQYADLYTDEQILQFSLVACIPDLGHGVKSHVTDMLHEGMGMGGENFHDTRAQQIVDLGGIQQVLDKYSIKSPFGEDGRIAIKAPGWVECPSPGLCVDRLHYVNAEGSLLFPDNEAFKEAIRLDNLIITKDGDFAFKEVEHARVWAKVANLCSSEHWNDPTNRLIEMLILEGMKRTIAHRYLENVDVFDNGYVGAPEDYTFLIDKDFDEALEREALNPRPDIFMNAVYSLIQSIAHRERQRYVRHKRPAYEQFLTDQEAREYPNELVNRHRAAFGIPPAQVEILSQKDLLLSGGGSQDGRALLRDSEGKTVGILKQLKIRQFDPLVILGDATALLSEADKNFSMLLIDNGRALNYVGAVALHANPESRTALIKGVEENREYMRQSKLFAPLSPDQIRYIIKDSGHRALQEMIRSGRWVEL